MYGFNDHRWADYYFESFAHTVGSAGKPYGVVDGTGAQSVGASSGTPRGRSVARGVCWSGAGFSRWVDRPRCGNGGDVRYGGRWVSRGGARVVGGRGLFV